MRLKPRLFILVLAVWLPAVIGFVLLARSTYEREEQAARLRVEQLANGVNTLVQTELDARAVLARTLAASAALQSSDLERFYGEAVTATVDGSGAWAFLVSPTEQLLNTRLPFGAPRPRGADRPWTAAEARVEFSARGPVVQEPVMAVFVPESRFQPPRYNIGIAFRPAVIANALASSPLPEGGLAAVLDGQQRVMGRTRDADKWLGASATGELAVRARNKQSGFAHTTTLDGVASLTYLSPPNRYGWAVAVALPLSSLTQTAARLTRDVLAAAAGALVIGLLMALAAARGIDRPLRQLASAAREVDAQSVAPKLGTGLEEVDMVSVVLHEASLRSHQATQTLQQRVAEAAAEARRAEGELMEARKHEAIGRLTGGLAHDFNNLLQTIHAALHVLDRTIQEGPQRRMVESASRACSRAAGLVRDMLAFGRAQPMRPEAVDLQDFLLRSQRLIGKAVEPRVRFAASIEPNLPRLYVDPGQLELALLNLLFNARDAMPEGGTVTVAARLATAEEAASLGAGPFVSIEVRDHGTGMSPEVLARALDPYFTTKPVGSGSGLGLTQVLSFARQSGGMLHLDSAPGQGTRALLVLPATQAPAAGTPAPHPAVSPTGGRLRILMVEDDLLVSSVVVPALEAAGHAVVLCSTADEARARLERSDEAFSIVFTDVVMPGAMTGIELAGWCAEHRSDLPVLIASGYSAQQTDNRFTVLRKPYDIDALLNALEATAGISVRGKG